MRRGIRSPTFLSGGGEVNPGRGIRHRPLEARPCVHSCIGVETAKGNRPSFTDAAPPEQAESLYDSFCDELGAQDVEVATGQFGARMAFQLINDGPVTIVLDT